MGRINRVSRRGGWLVSLVLVTAFAYVLQGLLSEVILSLWIKVPILFLAGKIAADLVSWGLNRSLSFNYLEDYLKEILGFTFISLGAALIIYASQEYLGGTVWLPLLAGAVATIWNR